ncbi:uncharacterized protein LOC126751984 isoform X3 [Bactrocera neohumeralis]|uniref:uncharacterized protein LOC126751984 isoform X3 n=1 Tax=Bactrocera neohumeralis TaxID=98809 RepID=UPI002165C09D|nr:uncharacterized protein LOC126751984 isoform X3 [Bactrocera neohumeralis]
MFKRTSYLVIVLLLLIQLISCLPRPSSSDAVDSILPGTTTITPSVGKNAVPSDLNSFEGALRRVLINISNFELQRTNQIAKDTLADPSMYSIDSEAMQKELSLLRKYVTDSNEALNKVLPADQLGTNTFFLFINDTGNIIDRFHRYRHFEYVPITPEKQVIWDALKKHGFLKGDEELDKRLNEYFPDLVDDFEKYVKTLSAAEKEKDKDMKEMMAAWSAYKNNELSKANFGKTLFQINFVNKIFERLRRP